MHQGTESKSIIPAATEIRDIDALSNSIHTTLCITYYISTQPFPCLVTLSLLIAHKSLQVASAQLHVYSLDVHPNAKVTVSEHCMPRHLY